MRTSVLLITLAFLAGCSQHSLTPPAPASLGPVISSADMDCDHHSQSGTLLTGSLCEPVNWLAAQYQIQAMSADERRLLMLSEPLDGDYGLMVMALLYSQPDSPASLRQLSQEALQSLLPRAPHDLHLHLNQLSRYNAALMEQEQSLAAQRDALRVRDDAQAAQQRVIEALQQALMTTRQQLSEKQAQVEALTDIESNLSGDRNTERPLPQPLELQLQHDD